MNKTNKKRKVGQKKPRPQKPSPMLPILHRPGAEMSFSLYIIGWAFRSIVLFCGIFGLTLFIGDSFGIFGTDLPGNIGVHALVCLCLTVVCSAAAWNSRLRLIAPALGILCGVGVLFIFTSNPFVLIWDGIRYVLNTAMRHMASLGYTSLADHLVGSEVYHGSDTLVTGCGMAVLAAIFALILSFSLLRRVHTIPAVILSVAVIVPIFTYNLTNTNGGVTMVIIFICGEISLLLYERKFSNYEQKRIDRRNAKKKRKDDRLAAKAQKKNERAALDRAAARSYAIALELTDDKRAAKEAKSAVYRLDRKNKSDKIKAAKKAAADEKKKARAAKKEDAKKRRAESAEKKRAAATERAELKALPPEARAARQNAAKEKRDSEKKAAAAAARERRRARNDRERDVRKTLSASGYAGGTAVILAALAVWLPFASVRGNFATIDFINEPVSVMREYVTAYLKGDDIDLNKLGNVAELTPRTLTYDSPEYKDMQMLAVETDRKNPIYLRGWIGMKFDSSTGTWSSATTDDVIEYRNEFGRSFAPDMLKTEFNKYVFPTSMLLNGTNIDTRFSKYGFDVQQVHLRRLNGESLIIFAPPTVRYDTEILGYNSILKNEARYSAYFDGIYSSRFFKRDVNYSTVSFINRMNDPEVAEGMAGAIGYFEMFEKYTDIVKEAENLLKIEGNTGAKRSYNTGFINVTIANDNLWSIDDSFLAECAANGLPSFPGESLLRRYIAMSTKEREEIEDYIETELEYREWADLSYGGSIHSSAVEAVADEILNNSGYTITKRDIGSIPVCTDKDGNTVPEHDVIMAVMNYLSDGYEYTLEPTPYDGDMTVLDSFLTETKNGYCTHFATAAASILREYGYFVRYAEGYLVNDFKRDYSENAPAKYRGYALDSDAHAWIEVYYPLLGWVSYETVPVYMDAAYSAGEVEDDPDIVIPDNPPIVPDQNDPDNVTPDVPDVPETPDEENPDESGSSVDQMTILMIVAIAAAGITLIVFVSRLVIRKLMRRAENIVADRHAHIVAVMDREVCDSGRLDCDKISREFDDTILRVMKILGYPPKVGEQYSEYAARLEEDFGQMTDYSLPQIFELIAKVEFGDGLTSDEMYILADFTDRLTASAYAGLTRFEKIKWRYLRHMI